MGQVALISQLQPAFLLSKFRIHLTTSITSSLAKNTILILFTYHFSPLFTEDNWSVPKKKGNKNRETNTTIIITPPHRITSATRSEEQWIAKLD
jgi:hypothetical protein